jgi:hypothetical protein
MTVVHSFSAVSMSRGTLQRHTTENSNKKIPRKGIARPQYQFPFSCVCEQFIYSTIGLPILPQENMWANPENIKSLTDAGMWK